MFSRNISATVYNATFYDENEQLEEYGNFSRVKNIVIPIVFVIVTLLGLVGNGIVIRAIRTNTKMRTPTYVLILNLALADFFFITICVPFVGVAYVLPKYIFGRVWCKICSYFIYVSACVSIYNLLLISVVRCIVVVAPLSSRSWVTTKRMYIAIAVVWIVNLSGFSPLLVQYDLSANSYLGEERLVCINLEALYSIYFVKISIVLFFTIGYALPLNIMIILYGIVLTALKCGAKQRKALSESEMKRNRAQGRTTRMVIAVVFCFLLCWLPLHVILMLQAFGQYPANVVGILGLMLANCLAYFNSCMNPILYAFLSSQFRHSFEQALCCGRHCGTRFSL